MNDLRNAASLIGKKDTDKDCIGIYIHVPFCRNKCGYCGFYSGSFPGSLREKYIGSLIKEIEWRGEELQHKHIDTIYIGGGTPSLLTSAEINGIFYTLRDVAGITNSNKDEMEVSVEANPEDIDRDIVSNWKSCGINRISLGIQSFNDDELKAIKRSNDSFTARRAAVIVRELCDNFSVDLMFGLPGQTTESLHRSLDEALSFHPDHISLYSLTFEERSLLTVLKERREIRETPEDVTVEMYRMLCECLDKAGYEHYEISNFCKPGFRSRHNSSYWSGKPYIGFGPGAHGYDGFFIRRQNPENLKNYISFFSGDSPVEGAKHFYTEEILDGEMLRDEFMLTRLRTSEGISIDEYRDRFGKVSESRLLSQAERFICSGMMRYESGYLRLTRDGVMVADNIILNISV